jgi:hypothetical protein
MSKQNLKILIIIMRLIISCHHDTMRIAHNSISRPTVAHQVGNTVSHSVMRGTTMITVKEGSSAPVVVDVFFNSVPSGIHADALNHYLVMHRRNTRWHLSLLSVTAGTILYHSIISLQTY